MVCCAWGAYQVILAVLVKVVEATLPARTGDEWYAGVRSRSPCRTSPSRWVAVVTGGVSRRGYLWEYPTQDGH
jgi:hypothetical protein